MKNWFRWDMETRRRTFGPAAGFYDHLYGSFWA